MGVITVQCDRKRLSPLRRRLFFTLFAFVLSRTRLPPWKFWRNLLKVDATILGEERAAAHRQSGSQGEKSLHDHVQGKLGGAAQARQWMEVDVRGLRVERVREFGEVYLALALWRRLGLHTLLRELIEPGRERVGWELVACILSVARFCGNKSELEVAERWYADSALEDLLGVRFSQINDARLYRGLDVLHAHKERLCRHLQERYESWFGVEFEFLLYDVTSTYFEGKAEGNPKAKRGYSRDKRSDCKQVNIGLVVTPEGLPIGYEVFAGNTADVTTVEDMVGMMEGKYGRAKRIWVMDRGMVSEDNLDFLRERQARYIVGTPKQQLRRFEAQLLDESSWAQVQPGVEVKLVEHPDGRGAEQYVLCRSGERRNKEAAMLEQQRLRLLAKLEKTDAGLRKAPAKDLGARRAAHRSLAGPLPRGRAAAPRQGQARRKGTRLRPGHRGKGRDKNLGRSWPTGPTCCAPTAPSKTPRSSGATTSTSRRPRSASRSARAI